jgi:glycosyltransferase involved in cell wall biosynthesis
LKANIDFRSRRSPTLVGPGFLVDYANRYYVKALHEWSLMRTTLAHVMTNRHIAILSPINRNPGKPHGGITPVVTNLANYFSGRGMRTDLVVFVPANSSLRPRGVASEIRVFNLGSVPKAINAYRLWQYLRQERPTVLLSLGWRANTIAAWCKRFPAVSTRIWGGIQNMISAGQQESHYVKRWRKNAGMRWSYRALDGLIAASQGVAEDFVHITNIPSENIHVIHNPVVKPDLSRRGPNSVNHPWFRPESPPVILGAGRLARQKDFRTLIRAFARVHAERHYRLVILGEGNDRAPLEALAVKLGLKDDIDLPGFVTNPFAYMSKAALFVLSSAWEGFGNVLAEAMALGVPVVSTDCPSGPREILQDGRYGPLVPVGDACALAKAMIDVLDHPPEKAFLQSASERFRVDKCGEAYLQVLFPA